MKFTYEELPEVEIVKRSDGAFIPKNPANSDYQRYLRWLENPDAPEGTLGTESA